MKSYSHSALSTYETCPLQYRFRYIDRIRVPFKSIEAFMGSRVHEVMERLYRDVVMGKVPALEVLSVYYEKLWSEQWRDDIVIVKTNYTEADYRELGRRCIESYYSRHHPFSRARTLALEKRVGLVLSEIEGYRITGFIDRLAQPEEGVYEIHDYKTSSTLPDQEKLDRDRQLALYQMAVERLYPDVSRVRLIWHYLVFDKAMESRRSAEQLEKLKEDTLSIIREIEHRSDFPPKENPVCPWCEYQERCPVRKHLVTVSRLQPREYRKDEGVKLVDEYARLDSEKKRLEAELAELKAALLDYCTRYRANSLRGSSHRLDLVERERALFPSRTKDAVRYGELRQVLKEHGHLEEVSEVAAGPLNAAIEAGQWDDELVKRVKEYRRRVKSVVAKLSLLKGDTPH